MAIYTFENNYEDKGLNSFKVTFIQSGRIKNTMKNLKNNNEDNFKYTILNEDVSFLIDPDIINPNSCSRVSFGCNILPEQATLFVIDKSGLNVQSKSFLRAEQESPAGLFIVNQNERRSKK